MDDEELIKAYIEKILERRESRTTQADLDTIASELGLGGRELERVKAFAAESRLKARNFAERRLWDDAIQAMRQALSLEPLNPELICELASYYGEKGALGDGKAAAEAEKLAREAMDIDPGLKAPYDLIQRLGSQADTGGAGPRGRRIAAGSGEWMGAKSRRRAALRSMKKRLILGAGLASAILLGGALCLMIFMKPGRAGGASAGRGGEGQKVYRPSLSFEAGEWKGKVDFKLADAEVRAYRDSQSYYVSATGFFSSEGYEISRLDLRTVLVDQNGKTVAERASSLPALGKSPAWPGESLGFFINFYQDAKAPRKLSLKLILDGAQCGPRAESYPALRPVKADFPENAVDRDLIRFSMQRCEGTILKNGGAWVEMALLVENDSARSVGDLSAEFVISIEGKDFVSKEQRLAGNYEASIPGKRKILIPLGVTFDGPFGDLKPQWQDIAMRIIEIQ